MKGVGEITHIYFLGIGGIGMSALARYFRHMGLEVAGYDRTPSGLTTDLEKEGIRIHYTDEGEDVRNLTGHPNQTLIVLTPAVPDHHGEWDWLKNNGYTILKRSKVLGMICNRSKCLAVAGTHGKTTISTMAAVILKGSEKGCGAFLGGISKNFNSNLVLPAHDNDWLVTEADEYDRSFLQLTPDIAVITYMDADHLDIYGSCDEMKEAFFRFVGQVRKGGGLVVNRELATEFSLPPDRQLHTYALTGPAGFFAADLHADTETGCYTFSLSTPSGIIPHIRMTYPGILNVENAVAAGAAAFLAGARPDEIRKGLESYSGVKRRFDIRFRSGQTLYIDDYGHHPRELKAFIRSVRLLWPGKKITGIFQPHLYTRTRDFAAEFAASLDMLDTAVLLPIYPARELPIEGVTSALILQHMTSGHGFLSEKSEICPFIMKHPPEILLTMGAGDIELLAEDIISLLSNE